MLEQFESALLDAVNIIENDSLRSASHHALFPAGKRFRPILLLTIVSELSADLKIPLSPAVAIELLHTASLIHDDLPALDNDNERRGRPTVHKAFSESTAVLAGDILPVLAIGLITNDSLLGDRAKVNIIRELSHAYKMVMEGQQEDLEQKLSLKKIHEKKTGALFETVLNIALYMTNKENLLKHGAEIGKGIGVGFQLLDDFIDRYGDSEDRGRQYSSDERNDKHTMTTIDEWNRAFQETIEKLKDELLQFEDLAHCKLVKTRALLSATFSRTKLVQVTL